MRELQLVIKRIIDVIASGLGILVLLPVMVAIMILVKMTSPGPIFFLQSRAGKNGKVFKLFKFRTMIPGAINKGTGLETCENDPRITRIGAFLRKSSLDELPQLFNVFKGDISLVGPRPTVPEQVTFYNDFQNRRLEVKPGVTGLAMIRGRNSNPWSVRIKYDVEYVDNFSLWLDFVILFKTVWVVLSRKDTYYDYEKNGPAFDLVKKKDVEQETKN